MLIDDSFTANERTPMVAGFRSWEACGHVRLNISYLSRSELDVLIARHELANTIFVLRDASCAYGNLAVTHRKEGFSFQCYDPTLIEREHQVAGWPVWQVAAAHEMGHSLLLDHSPLRGSVMWLYAGESYAPGAACSDFVELGQKWGFEWHCG